MSTYSTNEEESYINGSLPDSDEHGYHDYNQYFDGTSERSTDESYRNRTGGKSSKFDDKGFNRIRRSISGKNQNVFIEYYETSSNTQVFIRDAISGAIRAPFRTGTTDEDMFFTVRLATGEGRVRGGSNLFYDSPEQYERHFYVKLSDKVKDAWREKYHKAQLIRKTLAEKNASKLVTLVK
jgi:hypothetical protein